MVDVLSATPRVTARRTALRFETNGSRPSSGKRGAAYCNSPFVGDLPQSPPNSAARRSLRRDSGRRVATATRVLHFARSAARGSAGQRGRSGSASDWQASRRPYAARGKRKTHRFLHWPAAVRTSCSAAVRPWRLWPRNADLALHYSSLTLSGRSIGRAVDCSMSTA